MSTATSVSRVTAKAMLTFSPARETLGFSANSAACAATSSASPPTKLIAGLPTRGIVPLPFAEMGRRYSGGRPRAAGLRGRALAPEQGRQPRKEERLQAQRAAAVAAFP